jgi:hypothetical protein
MSLAPDLTVEGTAVSSYATPSQLPSSLIASELLSPELRRSTTPPMRLQLPPMPAARAELVLQSLGRMARFRGLQEGWDGRRGRPVSDLAFQVAASIAVQLIAEGDPKLQMVPLPRGGIQLEWHVMDNDLEIEVSENGKIHILAETDKGEYQIDREIAPALFRNSLADVGRFLKRLARLLEESR